MLVMCALVRLKFSVKNRKKGAQEDIYYTLLMTKLSNKTCFEAKNSVGRVSYLSA